MNFSRVVVVALFPSLIGCGTALQTRSMTETNSPCFEQETPSEHCIEWMEQRANEGDQRKLGEAMAHLAHGSLPSPNAMNLLEWALRINPNPAWPDRELPAYLEPQELQLFSNQTRIWLGPNEAPKEFEGKRFNQPLPPALGSLTQNEWVSLLSRSTGSLIGYSVSIKGGHAHSFAVPARMLSAFLGTSLPPLSNLDDANLLWEAENSLREHTPWKAPAALRKIGTPPDSNPFFSDAAESLEKFLVHPPTVSASEPGPSSVSSFLPFSDSSAAWIRPDQGLYGITLKKNLHFLQAPQFSWARTRLAEIALEEGLKSWEFSRIHMLCETYLSGVTQEILGDRESGWMRRTTNRVGKALNLGVMCPNERDLSDLLGYAFLHAVKQGDEEGAVFLFHYAHAWMKTERTSLAYLRVTQATRRALAETREKLGDTSHTWRILAEGLEFLIEGTELKGSAIFEALRWTEKNLRNDGSDEDPLQPLRPAIRAGIHVLISAIRHKENKAYAAHQELDAGEAFQDETVDGLGVYSNVAREAVVPVVQAAFSLFRLQLEPSSERNETCLQDLKTIQDPLNSQELPTLYTKAASLLWAGHSSVLAEENLLEEASPAQQERNGILAKSQMFPTNFLGRHPVKEELPDPSGSTSMDAKELALALSRGFGRLRNGNPAPSLSPLSDVILNGWRESWTGSKEEMETRTWLFDILHPVQSDSKIPNRSMERLRASFSGNEPTPEIATLATAIQIKNQTHTQDVQEELSSWMETQHQVPNDIELRCTWKSPVDSYPWTTAFTTSLVKLLASADDAIDVEWFSPRSSGIHQALSGWNCISRPVHRFEWAIQHAIHRAVALRNEPKRFHGALLQVIHQSALLLPSASAVSDPSLRPGILRARTQINPEDLAWLSFAARLEGQMHVGQELEELFSALGRLKVTATGKNVSLERIPAWAPVSWQDFSNLLPLWYTTEKGAKAEKKLEDAVWKWVKTHKVPAEKGVLLLSIRRAIQGQLADASKRINGLKKRSKGPRKELIAVWKEVAKFATNPESLTQAHAARLQASLAHADFPGELAGTTLLLGSLFSGQENKKALYATLEEGFSSFPNTVRSLHRSSLFRMLIRFEEFTMDPEGLEREFLTSLSVGRGRMTLQEEVQLRILLAKTLLVQGEMDRVKEVLLPIVHLTTRQREVPPFIWSLRAIIFGFMMLEDNEPDGDDLSSLLGGVPGDESLAPTRAFIQTLVDSPTEKESQRKALKDFLILLLGS